MSIAHFLPLLPHYSSHFVCCCHLLFCLVLCNIGSGDLDVCWNRVASLVAGACFGGLVAFALIGVSDVGVGTGGF